MKIPSRTHALSYLEEAQALNPGAWVAHSLNVARAAEAIAAAHPDLDPGTAFVLGSLHDIGRRAGVTSMRHALDGYTFLCAEGYDDAARVCLTHSFPVQHIQAVLGEWDCTAEEFQFVERFLEKITFNTYDRLIQLADALALPDGLTIVEKRIVDVALRHGVNEWSLARWRVVLGLVEQFEAAMGQPLYSVLPGIVESTLHFNPCDDHHGTS